MTSFSRTILARAGGFLRCYILTILNVAIILLSLCVIVFGKTDKTVVFLPGTQPMTTKVEDAPICQQCHGPASRPDITIYNNWSGSMMANSARDPIFYAALAITNKVRERDSPGEYCIRCHAPAGWLAGHSEDFSGRSIVGSDQDGVQCDYCHRIVDPLHPDSTVAPHSAPVAGYGNGMHVIQYGFEPKHGPYSYPYIYPDSSHFSPPHRAERDPFIEQAELCGICHDVSNPFQVDPEVKLNQPPYSYAPMERTFSEWAMSYYATLEDSGTCQSCHMKDTTGFACIYAAAPLRDNIAAHDMTGGNTFAPDIIRDFFPEADSTALLQGKARAIRTLQRAAALDVQSYHSGDSVIAMVRVTNLTGHKLPTGYPDGRRMWISLVALNTTGDTVFQSGIYDSSIAVLTKDNHLKIYEALQGITDSTASSFGLTPGQSLMFAMNDTILFDNRIPPRGFNNFSFQERLAAPVGVTYNDDQYWDDTKYVLPTSAATVSVRVMYQTISKEYVDFLRDNNVGNTYDWNRWGARLDSSWQVHGKSRPVEMNAKTVIVQDSLTEVRQSTALPVKFTVAQDYPNPFNPTTSISYELGSIAHVSIVVYNTLGEEIARLVDETKPSG